MELLDTKGGLISSTQIERSLHISTMAGVVGTVFFVATSGAFLTSFARKLGASQFQIGLISGVMPFAGTAQLLSAFLIETHGWQRKPVLLLSMAVQRLLWVPILLLPYYLGAATNGFKDAAQPAGTAQGTWLLLGLIVLSGLVGGFGGLAWQAWIADLVPEQAGPFSEGEWAAVNAMWIVSNLCIGAS